MSRRNRDTWSRSEPSWQASGGDKASEGYSGWSRRDTRGNSSSGQADNTATWISTREKPLQITLAEIWKLPKILESSKSSFSPTYKKNAEANTKVCELNQKTMQALSNLALVYARFEEAEADLEVDTSEGDPLHGDMRKALEGPDEVQQQQERFKEEQKHTRDSLDTAFIELNNRRDLHDAACRGLEDVGKKSTEMKRKADDVHDRISSHKEQCRRATKEFVLAEEELNNSLGRLGQLIKNTAGATHAISCGVPDGESNEARCLQDTLDMIEEFQRRGSSRGTAEITLVERQQKAHLTKVRSGERVRGHRNRREACAEKK